MNFIHWCRDGSDKTFTKGGQQQRSHGGAIKKNHGVKGGKGDGPKKILFLGEGAVTR